MKTLKNNFTDLISLLYPELCQACGNSLFKNEKLICLSCLYKLPKTNFHLENHNVVEKIFWGRINFEKATSYLYFAKGGRVQSLMHAFKYNSKRDIGITLAEDFARELKKSNWLDGIDMLIPVPLHDKKKRLRGYNQSEVLAMGIENISSIPIDLEVLTRIKTSETQTKKSRYRRWENVNEIFQINNPEKIENKQILLIDDVITTGATIEACASLLLEIKGLKLSIASLAYANI